MRLAERAAIADLGPGLGSGADARVIPAVPGLWVGDRLGELVAGRVDRGVGVVGRDQPAPVAAAAYRNAIFRGGARKYLGFKREAYRWEFTKSRTSATICVVGL